MRFALMALVTVAGCGAATDDEGPTDLAMGRDLAAPRDLGPPADLAAPPPLCVDGADAGAPATLASVERITNDYCVASGCHGGPGTFSQFADLDLRPGHVRASLVGVAAAEACGGVRVVPGDAQRSFFYQKVANPDPCSPPDAGYLQMPRCEDGTCPIKACEIDVIRRWIEAGAL